MKTWNKPEVEELDVQETAHNFFGRYNDGGYIGDGIISGHLSWDTPEDPKPAEPSSDPVNELS